MKKTIVITGGTGGIGHAAVVALLKQGNDVIFQGRDAEKGKKIVEGLSGMNRSAAKFIAADVSTIDGIKNLAVAIKALTNKIDVLIHSAAVLNPERRETKDGLYEGFTVNYLCKFMLDYLLLDELRRSEGSIIIVGGQLMKNAVINFDDLQMKTSYSLMKSLGQKALGDYMHAQEFTRQNDGSVPINIIHPGVVKNTGIDRNVNGIMKFLSNVYTSLTGNSSQKAIANILALAEINAKESGYFYPKLANTTVKEKISTDASVASKLWDVSMQIAKLNRRNIELVYNNQ